MMGMRERDRRDRVRDAADPRLRADRARRLVQADCAGRHADRRWRSIDAQGRAFQTHTNWIQVRPGERRTCDGCHSPRRGGALNSGAVVNTSPTGAARPRCQAAHQSGETMAGTRTRLDPTR